MMCSFRTSWFFLAALVMLAIAPVAVMAQETGLKGTFGSTYDGAPPPMTLPKPPRRSPSPPVPSGIGASDTLELEATPELRRALATKSYAHQEWVYDHQRNVFVWQLWTSRLSFLLVLALTGAGLWFSWIQFSAVHSGKTGHSTDMTSELVVSGKEIKVSSPVLGVVILTISMGFFYLFVLHVYPIEKVDTLPGSAPIRTVDAK